ncbi:MAG: STM4011 family radical SAM protein [Kofleriaceae bacterium]
MSRRIARSSQVTCCAVQTNLSAPLDWVARANRDRLALWCTSRPEWTTEVKFLAQCRTLDEHGIAYSVGVVGQREYEAAARSLRAALPAATYVWINAVKALAYAPEEIASWRSIDPLFELNNQRYASLGKPCGAGERDHAITVDGDGTMRRCHFISDPIGNLYGAGWQAALVPRACSQLDCHCHIGYHLDHLELDKVFATGLLERVPTPEARAGGVRLPVVA